MTSVISCFSRFVHVRSRCKVLRLQFRISWERHQEPSRFLTNRRFRMTIRIRTPFERKIHDSATVEYSPMDQELRRAVMDLKELEAVANREMTKHGCSAGSRLATTSDDWRVQVSRKRIEIASFNASNNPQESVPTRSCTKRPCPCCPRAGHGPNGKPSHSIGRNASACDNSNETQSSRAIGTTCSACKRSSTVQATDELDRLPSMSARFAADVRVQRRSSAKAIRAYDHRRIANWKRVCGDAERSFRLRRPKEASACKCPHRCDSFAASFPKNGHRVAGCEFLNATGDK